MASLLAAVPARFTTSALRLAYSTAVHGVSVSTFYARTRGAVPALLVARDGAGGVFGAYTTAEWRVGPRWTRKNPYFQLGAERHLAVGGGGGFALWLDDEFRGTTAASDTFGSPVLCLEGGREGGGASTPLAGARVGSHTILDPPREERRFECVVFEAWALETAVSTLRGA
ncbi:hypothetical protein I4F81_008416 [Pyropia yezoensis]|uniref:Uncharacterized protein n=1 Tax=Pyropia yezoensis TaxID=2788 RepID=A0ACC3C7Z8_PYRYE|nr:hypothetical protein I4F81_008416 [Neopyropia yezoensis]